MRSIPQTVLQTATRKPPSLALLLLAALVIAGGSRDASAQTFRQAGTEFQAMRLVSIASEELKPVMVVEFLHHGQLNAQGTNLLITARTRQHVPVRVLQLGPGDFCRLAFQTIAGQREYEVYYGGEPPTEPAPAWTNQDGLLLETRRWKDCNLDSLDSVRRAFEQAEPIGADYVDAVFHACNPFSLKDEPFLSRYRGRIQIERAGRYGFFTSSRDASFLLIDGQQVVAASGRHGPTRRARPETLGSVQLSAGAHLFEYYHAAAGSEAVMAAAWTEDPAAEKPQPKRIPPELLRTASIGRAAAGLVTRRDVRLVPDFRFTIAGDVPLPGEPLPLVGVGFRNLSAPALTMRGRVNWDFGDGQTSSQLHVDHVYLRPGLYQVTLSVDPAAGRQVVTTSRIYVDRPRLTRKDEEKFHDLDQYLPVLRTYDPTRLDAVSLRQLIRAYETKADALLDEALAEDAGTDETGGQGDTNAGARPGAGARLVRPRAGARADLLAESREYVALAVAAGKAALTSPVAAEGEDALWGIAELTGPMARDRLGDSQAALAIWRGAAERTAGPERKAACLARAADIAVNDLLDRAAAKALLDEAQTLLGQARTGAEAAQLQRVWGDYYALAGDGEAARKAYAQAATLHRSAQGYVERTAWEGAHTRSTEEFLKEGHLDRAAAEIHLWQREFPDARIDGYLTLMYTRYWATRGMYDQAVAQAEQLQTVNPDSPYVDRVLWLAAECELGRGRKDRALATLHSILTGYPGSPLVPQVKQRIAELEAEGSPPAGAPGS